MKPGAQIDEQLRDLRERVEALEHARVEPMPPEPPEPLPPPLPPPRPSTRAFTGTVRTRRLATDLSQVVYSSWCAFNADDGGDPWVMVEDGETKRMKVLDLDGGLVRLTPYPANRSLRWDTSDPERIWFVDHEGRLKTLNVVSGIEIDVGIGGIQTIGHGEGDMNGVMLPLVTDSGVVAYNTQVGLGTKPWPLNLADLDNVHVTRRGALWSVMKSGRVEGYDDGGLYPILPFIGHAADVRGNAFVISGSNAPATNVNQLQLVGMDGAVRSISPHIGWDDALHISGSPDPKFYLPWCLVSTYGPRAGDRGFGNMLFAVWLDTESDGTPKTPHLIAPTGTYGFNYVDTPRASVSRDGRYAVWNGRGHGAGGPTDVYLVETGWGG